MISRVHSYVPFDSTKIPVNIPNNKPPREGARKGGIEKQPRVTIVLNGQVSTL